MQPVLSACLALALRAALPSPEVGQTLALPPAAAEMLIIHREPVQLPPAAVARRIRGIVRFTIHVGPDGRVRNAILVDGHPLLVEAARKAVMKYRFSPFLFNGRPQHWRSVISVRVPAPDRSVSARPV